MASSFRAFWNSPVGPKTTHFWGPAANWGIVIAVGYTTFILSVSVYLSIYETYQVREIFLCQIKRSKSYLSDLTVNS